MSEIKSKLDVNQEVHICGDFNCNMLKRPGLSSSIHDICNLIGATQLVTEPARVTQTSSTLIYLLLTTKEEKTAESGVIHASISDHSIVYAIIKGKRLRVLPRIIQTRSFKAFISEKFEDLFNSNWNSVYEADDVHGASKAFTKIVNEVADRHAPKVNIKVKGNLPLTFSDELILLMKERDNAKLIAARTKLSEDWIYYKKLRNRVNRLKHHEKKNYFNETLRENSHTPKQLWKKLKELVPSKITKSSKVQRIQVKDPEVTDKKQIADYFNDFFINIGRKLASQITLRGNPLDYLQANTQPTDFKFEQATGSDVLSKIRKLKEGKSMGLDGISVKTIKAGESALSGPLTYIFNLSISTGEVPDIWKYKCVSPFHKSGNKLKITHYRPISVQPIALKLLEQIIQEQSYKFLSENGVINSKQSGFRRSHSTATATIDVTNYILEKFPKET